MKARMAPRYSIRIAAKDEGKEGGRGGTGRDAGEGRGFILSSPALGLLPPLSPSFPSPFVLDLHVKKKGSGEKRNTEKE